MKMYNPLFMILFVVLAPFSASGASLAGLQQKALENRAVIERYKANVTMGQKDEIIAKSGYYPSLDIGYTVNELDERSLYEARENSTIYGAVTWNLFAGFQDKFNLKAARLTRRVEEHRLAAIKQDIQYTVALRYLLIFNRQANLEVADDSYKTLSKLYEDSRNRYEVGLIKKNELLRFKVDLDNALISLKKARAAVNKSVLLLQREIGCSPIALEELEFAEFDQLPELGDDNYYEEKMLENRSELKVVEELSQAARAQARASYALHYPRVDFTGSYSKYDDEIITGSGNYDDEFRAQMVLSLNLFDGHEIDARVSKAELEAKALLDDLSELKNDLTTELANLFLDYQVNRENVDVAIVGIEQAEENLRITRLSYKQGIDRESDVLDAIANLSRAKYNYVSAKSALFENYFSIIRAVEDF